LVLALLVARRSLFSHMLACSTFVAYYIVVSPTPYHALVIAILGLPLRSHAHSRHIRSSSTPSFERGGLIGLRRVRGGIMMVGWARREEEELAEEFLCNDALLCVLDLLSLRHTCALLAPYHSACAHHLRYSPHITLRGAHVCVHLRITCCAPTHHIS